MAWVTRILNKNFQKTCILMYHRIGYADTDAWRLSVTPENFEEHLEILADTINVVSLPQLLSGTSDLRKKNVALTFDDGYEDNYIIAKPLLEKLRLPATFFIATGHIGTPRLYWWDALEILLLRMDLTQESITLRINDQLSSFDFGDESSLNGSLRESHRLWRGFDKPVSRRTELYQQIWQKLRPATNEQQQAVLAQLHAYAVAPAMPPGYQCMSRLQVRECSEGSLITIGSHTCTHPWLGTQNALLQEAELAQSKSLLENWIEKTVNMLAYPYGNYNAETVEIARRCGYIAGFSTEAVCFDGRTDRYQAGRFAVDNVGGAAFRKNIRSWFKS